MEKLLLVVGALGLIVVALVLVGVIAFLLVCIKAIIDGFKDL